jgi:hypothetical protein
MFSNCKQYGFTKCCSSLRSKSRIKCTQCNPNVVEINKIHDIVKTILSPEMHIQNLTLGGKY